MSGINSIIISNNEAELSKYDGKLILTNYGISRALQKIDNAEGFVPINLTKLVIGNKPSKHYSPAIKDMRNGVIAVKLDPTNFSVEDQFLNIKISLDIPGEVAFQEVGIYEEINGAEYLFAYASGFNVYKPTGISYDLTIKLSLKIGMYNEHYSKYEVLLSDPNYALDEDMSKLFRTLTDVQLDLEKCVTLNSKRLGYKRAEPFKDAQEEVTNCLENTLLYGRYIKLLPNIAKLDMSDGFIYPSPNIGSKYQIKNLRDEGSIIKVTDKLQIANYDHIDLSKPISIVVACSLTSLAKEGLIIGKINPNDDESYFDFRIEVKEEINEYGIPYQKQSLVFSIYSYDKDLAYLASRGHGDEKKVVGWYRLRYTPDEVKATELQNGEKTFTIMYNGDIENPEVQLYINENKITDVDIDSFNFMGPCEYFRDRCALRNYTQTVGTLDYKDPIIYVLDSVKISQILVFRELLTPEIITYISLINQT